MTAVRLIRFYPRAWRDRYGAEFVEMIGPGALHTQQVIDIAMAAIDAWLSADVRQSATNSSIVTNPGGRAMLAASKTTCGGPTMRFTSRDMWISGAVFGGGGMALSALGGAIGQFGYPVPGGVLQSLAFPLSLTASMPFFLMKGQPWRAKVVVLGVTFAIIMGAGYLATLI